MAVSRAPLPQIEAFKKRMGYSSYARGCDLLVGTYNYLDFVPKGRDETELPWTMAWVRHHDRYDDEVFP